MTIRNLSAIALFIVVPLAGCATQVQVPVPMANEAIKADSGRIGVAMTALPKVDTSFPGAGCLLCIGVASLAHTQLTKATQALPLEDLPMLKELVAERLRKRGAQAIVINEPLDIDQLESNPQSGPNLSAKDFRPLAKKLGVDRLVVIQITEIGISRSYAAYIPTADPKAIVKGFGFMINLGDNKYDWHMTADNQRAADGTWDEPPKYPGLSNAYFQVLEMSKDRFLGPFSN